MTNYELGQAIKFSTEIVKNTVIQNTAYIEHSIQLRFLLECERKRASIVEFSE